MPVTLCPHHNVISASGNLLTAVAALLLTIHGRREGRRAGQR
jgi:hypothetical protein